MEQWSRNYQLSTPRTGQEDSPGVFVPFTNFIMIAIDSAQTSGLRLDGVALTNPDWVELTGESSISTYSGRAHIVHACLAMCLHWMVESTIFTSFRQLPVMNAA